MLRQPLNTILHHLSLHIPTRYLSRIARYPLLFSDEVNPTASMVSSEPVYDVHDLRQGHWLLQRINPSSKRSHCLSLTLQCIVGRDRPVEPTDSALSNRFICVHGLAGHACKTWTHS